MIESYCFDIVFVKHIRSKGCKVVPAIFSSKFLICVSSWCILLNYTLVSQITASWIVVFILKKITFHSQKEQVFIEVIINYPFLWTITTTYAIVAKTSAIVGKISICDGNLIKISWSNSLRKNTTRNTKLPSNPQEELSVWEHFLFCCC